jgi:hypothetical protein
MRSVNNKPFTNNKPTITSIQNICNNKKNLNTYMFTKHIQTYKHNGKIIKTNKAKINK